MDEIPDPKLAPPGAGLPLPELLIARLIFGFRRLTGSRDTFDAHFSSERATIGSLVESCEPESRSKRVLIQRVRGLEDSSRYWSVLMTLDHLRIVNRSITGLIGALSKAECPPGKASTAAVKPNPAVTESVIADYEASCDDLLAVVADTSDLKTKERFIHPWFGSMDASGWHAMAALHLGIHRVQIERIMKGLER